MTEGFWEKWLECRDERARAWLIEHYSPMVESALRQFRGVRSQDREDLRGAGYLGLIKAIDQWNPARMPWNQFAFWRIKYAMVDQIRAMSWVPRHLREKAGQIEDAEDLLTAELGRKPTTEELAIRLGMDLDELGAELSAMFSTDWHINSLDWQSELSIPFYDSITDETAAIPEEEALMAARRLMLTDLLDRLPERERHVVVEHYLAERSRRSIADDLGIHESRVSQLLNSGLANLRALARQLPLKLPVEKNECD